MSLEELEINCRYIRSVIDKKYGDRVIFAMLAGSRAKRSSRPNSDWDVVVVLRDEPSREVGPIRLDDKFKALDGNEVEYFRMCKYDFDRLLEEGNKLVCEASAEGVYI